MPDFSHLDTIDVESKPVDSSSSNSGNSWSNVRQESAGKGKLAAYTPRQAKLSTFESGKVTTANATQMIPPAIQLKLSALSTRYGVPFDIGKMSTQIATPENLNAFRNLVDMHKRNSKLLPEFFKLVKELYAANIREAEFYEKVTEASLEHQEKIDDSMASMFANMVKHEFKSVKRDHKANRQAQLEENKTQAWQTFYEDTSIANELGYVDALYQGKVEISRMRQASKLNRVDLKTARRNADSQHDIDAHQASSGHNSTDNARN